MKALAKMLDGERWIDSSIAALCWWTLCCNLTVWTRGTGWQLLITAAVSAALLVAGALILRARRTALLAPAPQPARASDLAATPFERALPKLRLAAAVLCVALFAFWPAKISNGLLWSLPATLVALFAALSLLEPWPEAHTTTSATPAWHRYGLWSFAVLGALITASLHLPNTDDVLYVNIGVALADDPARVLFSTDTLHGATVIPHTAYHLHSFELLAGAISWITGIPPLGVFHLGLAVIAGLLAPFAWARLFRLLDPARALWMVAVVMLWFVLDGTTPFSLSMHAFARLFQGKSVLFTVGLPAIAAYGLEFGMRPTARSFAWLVASQIAGLGLSSTGIWLCPLVAVAAVAAALPVQLRALKTLALACGSCVYPIAMGIWVLVQMRDGHGTGTADGADAALNEAATAAAAGATKAASSLFSADAGFERIRKAISLTFLSLDRGLVYCAFLVLAWPLARTRLARRYVASFMVVGLFLLCSPWLAAAVAKYVTGFSTYPRVTWFLPFGVALALCFTAPIATEGARNLRLGSLLLSAALAIAFFTLTPKETVLRAAALSWPPRLKVEQPAYDIARRLRKELPAGAAVLAPRAVSLHLPMLRRAPLPIMTKERYFSREDGKRRMALRRRVEQKGASLDKGEQKALRARLDAYRIRGVVLTEEAAQTPGLIGALERAGFRQAGRVADHTLWTRKRADSPD